MRISDWSSDVCSSDLSLGDRTILACRRHAEGAETQCAGLRFDVLHESALLNVNRSGVSQACGCRSEEHTSELQSLMRISYAVFCLKKKKNNTLTTINTNTTIYTSTTNIKHQI